MKTKMKKKTKKKTTIPDILILIGSIVVLISFFLPWNSNAYDYLYRSRTGLGFAEMQTSHISGMPGFTYFIVPVSALICLILLGIHVFSKLKIKNGNLIVLIVAALGILPLIQLMIELGTWTAAYTLRYGLLFTLVGLLSTLTGALINFLQKR